MLKMVAGGERDGKAVTIVMLGLSHENLRRLKDGNPITFNGSTVAWRRHRVLDFCWQG
jgi:hypothetical protein